MKVAIIGAGWAGLAAAVQATQQGHAVTLFEAARTAGGRARALPWRDAAGTAWPLDNGQHILIGAYADSLRLMQTVGVDLPAALHRMPLALVFADGSGLRLPDAAHALRCNSGWQVPGLHSPIGRTLRGILRAQGWPLGQRLALLRRAARWRAQRFECAPQATVADLCRGLPPGLMAAFIEPLCVSALNTPPAQASGAVFLRVLRDALLGAGFQPRRAAPANGGTPMPHGAPAPQEPQDPLLPHWSSADLLLPRQPLGALLADPALAWLSANGAQLRLGQRVQQIALAPAAPPMRGSTDPLGAINHIADNPVNTCRSPVFDSPAQAPVRSPAQALGALSPTSAQAPRATTAPTPQPSVIPSATPPDALPGAMPRQTPAQPTDAMPGAWASASSLSQAPSSAPPSAPPQAACWQVDGERFDAVILACPPGEAARLVNQAAQALQPPQPTAQPRPATANPAPSQAAKAPPQPPTGAAAQAAACAAQGLPAAQNAINKIATAPENTCRSPVFATPSLPLPLSPREPSLQPTSPMTDSPMTDSPMTDSPMTDSPMTDSPMTDSPMTAALRRWAAQAQRFGYQAITTVYAQAAPAAPLAPPAAPPGQATPQPAAARLALPMLALRPSAAHPAQFVFDRGQLGGPPGLLAFVVSASQGARADVQQQVVAQAAAELGLTVTPLQTIVEKRATFACTPRLARPAQQIWPAHHAAPQPPSHPPAPPLLACGDWCEGPYPATLEGAVRSGLQAAALLDALPPRAC